MGKYKVLISKPAEKEIYKLSVKEILKIKEAIMALADNPRPFGVKKLEGFNDLFVQNQERELQNYLWNRR